MDVVQTARTRTVPIDDEVVAAQQRVADFFHANRVLEQPQQVEHHVDRSFNNATFAAWIQEVRVVRPARDDTRRLVRRLRRKGP